MVNINLLLSKNAVPVIQLGTRKSKEKEVKKLKKRLKGGEKFQIDRGGVVYLGQNFYNGIARWRRPVCITDGQTSTRWCVFELHHAGHCSSFAIKADVAAQHPQLPGTQLSREERQLIYDIADELRRDKDCREIIISTENPEQRSVEESRNQVTGAADPASLSKVMSSSPLIQELCMIAVLANLRPWLPPAMRPCYITNFVTDGRKYSSQMECLRQLLRALNFTSEADHPFLIEITAEDVKDLQTWESIGNRMALIHCGRKIAAVLRRQAEQANIAGSAGQFTEELPAQALLDSGAVRLSACIDNIELPSCQPEIGPEQQEALRRALARILDHPKKGARQLVTLYQRKMHLHDAYRLSPADAWKQSAQEIFLHFYPFCSELFEDAAEQKRQLAKQRNRQLQEAISLVLTPSRYLKEIRSWPASYEDAKELLEGTREAVALVNRQGALCFSHDSLRRLTSRVGLPGTMYDAFIDRLKEIGAIEKRTQSLHFKAGSNGRFITISAEKCHNFSVSDISATNGGNDDER